MRCANEHMGRKARTNPAQLHGLESKEKSSYRRGVLLDFPFYRTYQELGRRNSRLIKPLTIGVPVTEAASVSQLLPSSRRRRLLACGNSD